MRCLFLILIALAGFVSIGCNRTVDASKFDEADWERQMNKPSLSEEEFTQLYALKVAADFKGTQVEVAGQGELKLKLKNGSELTAYLDNAWAEAKQNPTNRSEIARRYLTLLTSTESRISTESTPPDTNNVVAVIRDTRFTAQFEKLAHKPAGRILFEPLVADLQVLYAADEEGQIHYLTESDRLQLDLSMVELRKLAKANLKRLLPEVKRSGSPPAFMLIADGTYESSLLLADTLWENLAKDVEGDIVAAVPSRDTLIFTGSKSSDGIRKVRQVIERVENGGSHLITGTLIVRRNGQWEKFTE